MKPGEENSDYINASYMPVIQYHTVLVISKRNFFRGFLNVMNLF